MQEESEACVEGNTDGAVINLNVSINFTICYCLSKKSCPFEYSEYLRLKRYPMKIELDLLYTKEVGSYTTSEIEQDFLYEN